MRIYAVHRDKRAISVYRSDDNNMICNKIKMFSSYDGIIS